MREEKTRCRQKSRSDTPPCPARIHHPYAASMVPTPSEREKTIFRAMWCVRVVDSLQILFGGRFKATTLCEKSKRDQKDLIWRRKWKWVLKNLEGSLSGRREDGECEWRGEEQGASKRRFCREKLINWFIIRTCLGERLLSVNNSKVFNVTAYLLYLFYGIIWWNPNKT